MPDGRPALKPLMLQDPGLPGTPVLAASPPPAAFLPEWTAGLPPLTDLEAPLRPAPGWSVILTAVHGGLAAVDAEVSPPAAAGRAGWAGAVQLDVSDVWLARLRVTGTVALWAGPLDLAGADDPFRIAEDAWAAAVRGEVAGALITVTWR